MKLRTWLGLTFTAGILGLVGASCASNSDTDNGPTACSQGTSLCGDVCIATESDPKNCGDCGVVCGPSEVCDRGTCSASCGQSEATVCAGGCVDTSRDDRHCGGCDHACGDDMSCQGGACVDDPGVPCDGPSAMCGSQCVNLDNATDHCGACDKACADGEACVIGACVPECGQDRILCEGACVAYKTDAANCGSCGKECAAGQGCVGGTCKVACQSGETACGDVCVKLGTDVNNCGACGKTCDSGEVCASGKCTLDCGADKTACSGLCVDTKTDPQYCGACGTSCKSGESCVDGACKLACGAGLQACGASCVNTKGDAKNCGACGNVCGVGESCDAGECKAGCGGGQTACGGACVDTSESSDHCGACGNVCGSSQVCSAGSCVAIADGNGAVGEAGTSKVALVHSSTSSANDVKSKLTPLGGFEAIDLIDAAASTPKLTELQAHDAVAVFTYLELQDRVALGDVLADYLDAGGGVVMFSYGAWERAIGDASTSASLLGRYAADYALMAPQGPVTRNDNGTIGTRVEPDSALLAGVGTFGCGAFCYRLTGAPIHGGVTVAQWNDSNPLVIRGEFNGHRVAELNFFAGSKNSSGSWDPATDGAQLIKNALLYVSPREVMATPRLDLGAVAVGSTSAETTLVYRNTGATARTISALGFSGPHAAEFAVAASLPLTLPAGGSASVKVGLTPAATGLRAATLSATVSGFSEKLTTLVTGRGL